VSESQDPKAFLGELVAKRIELDDDNYTITPKYESSGPPGYRLYR